MSSRSDIAISFLQAASSGDVNKAYDRCVHRDFIHHNAYFKGDRETLRKGMVDNAREFPDKTYEVLRVLEDKNLVAVHGKVTLNPDMVFSVIHIFRFEDDRIIEAWEASQELLMDSPNENGIF